MVELPVLWRARAHVWASLVVALILGGVGFLPQFGGPGYEAALAAGLVLPAAAAIATALEISALRPEPWLAIGRGCASGALLASIGLAVTMLHGFRVGFCDPLEGLWLYLLGPAIGAVLGGAWGSVAGSLAARAHLRRKRRRWAAVLLGIVGPLSGVVVSLYRFYTTPMVFAFDPYFGYFSGPLYDTVIDVFWTLFTYRVGSACTLLFLVVLSRHATFDERGGLRLLRPRQLGVPILGLGALLGSLTHTAYGPELGHFSTNSSIERSLGRRHEGKRCDIVYSSVILERDVKLFARDCDAHVPVIESYFGARGPDKIRVYLFSSDDEKGRLMGASRTYIAKPWREEVYVQFSSYPHPVIGHELAHVIAGNFGAGPFRVAGPLGGIIPDPGRIEGIAVAAAADEDDELTATEWAAAMLKLDLLPELPRLFRLGFLGQPSSRAYTVAGSFVSWFTEKYGKEKLRAWYGGTDLEQVTGGKDIRALEREFRAHLRRFELPEQALLTARARFDRPAFFARPCPRIVDRLVGQADQRLSVGDWHEAEQRYQRILKLDPYHTGARFGLATCARRRGDDALALARYTELSKRDELARVEQATALETVGDIHYYAGRTAEADKLYQEIMQLLFDEGRLRTLEVKRWAVNGLAKEAIGALLIGDPELGPSWDVAAPLLALVGERQPEQGVIPYLIGRNLLMRGRYRDATRYLDQSLSRPIELLRVRREALRNRLVVACAQGELERGGDVLTEYVHSSGATRAQVQGALRLAARCGVQLSRIKSPLMPPPVPGAVEPVQIQPEPAR